MEVKNLKIIQTDNAEEILSNFIYDKPLVEKICQVLNCKVKSRKEVSAILTEFASYLRKNDLGEVGIPAACASSVYSASQYFNLSRSDYYEIEAKDLMNLDVSKYKFKIFLYEICCEILRRVDYSEEVC